MINAGDTLSTPPGIVTKSSPFGIPETLTRIKAAIAAQGLTLFAQIDHSDLAQQVDLQMPAAHVLIFGNPRGGTPLMIVAPLLALELPLKVLIWQDINDLVWVSFTSGTYLAERYGISIEQMGPLNSIQGLIDHALHG